MNNNFEEYVVNYFKNNYENDKLIDSIIYSIQDGKRFRANLFFSIIKGFGYNEEDFYDVALAIEMVHCYSLIHDDLPAMDNDDLRRGKLTCHKKFGEDIAILAGDGLLTDAFKVLARCNVADPIKIKLIDALSEYAGLSGMVHGQYLDLTSKIDNIELLDKIEYYKTTCLFKCCLYWGMYLGKDEANKKFYDNLAYNMGKLFQLQDDLFSITKSVEEMGKTNLQEENKFTALSIYSVDELKNIINNMFKDTYSLIENNKSFNNEYLIKLIKKMEKR